jgi:Beta protein
MEMRKDYYRHYVPVLRWKAAEIAAITQLTETVKSGITSLIELCPSAFNKKESSSVKPESIVSKKSVALTSAFNQNPFMVDLVHIPETIRCSNGSHIWNAIIDEG